MVTARTLFVCSLACGLGLCQGQAAPDARGPGKGSKLAVSQELREPRELARAFASLQVVLFEPEEGT